MNFLLRGLKSTEISLILWAMLSDRLKELRIKDLNLDLEKSWVFPYIQKLYAELDSKNIKLKPKIWISDDWFCPDGTTGFAIPFYLLNKELIDLEVSMIGEAEGKSADWLMMLLRHETAHALDNAYYLRRNKKRQKLFGLTSVPYPISYTPKPYDKNYVAHLEPFYAQAHPDEDWAETFAVWLNPQNNWKKTYEDWPALKKLKLCDELMNQIKGKEPYCKRFIKDTLYTEIEMTLFDYYKEKKKRLRIERYKKFEESVKGEFCLSLLKQLETSKKDQLVANLCKSIHKRDFIVKRYIESIQEICSRSKFDLKKNKRDKKIDLIEALMKPSNEYFKSGLHKVYM